MANNYELPSGDHRIPLNVAVEMTERYRIERVSILKIPDENVLPLSETFNGDAIHALMNTPGAVALRIYYGMTTDKNIHAILVAVDQTGTDILPSSTTAQLTEGDEIVLEEGQRCPYTCPPESPLNTNP